MGETEEDGAKPLRQPKKDGSQKPIRQAENEIPVFALFAILANMDPRTTSELIAKKNVSPSRRRWPHRSAARPGRCTAAPAACSSPPPAAADLEKHGEQM